MYPHLMRKLQKVALQLLGQVETVGDKSLIKFCPRSFVPAIMTASMHMHSIPSNTASIPH